MLKNRYYILYTILFISLIDIISLNLYSKRDIKSIVEISDDINSFNKLILNNDKPCIVKFYANWCSPCRAMKSVFYSLYDKFESKLDFFEVDIDKNRSLSKKYNINSVPTIILFKDGSIKGVLKGYNNLSKLESFINNILK